MYFPNEMLDLSVRDANEFVGNVDKFIKDSTKMVDVVSNKVESIIDAIQKELGCPYAYDSGLLMCDNILDYADEIQEGLNELAIILENIKKSGNMYCRYTQAKVVCQCELIQKGIIELFHDIQKLVESIEYL